MPRKSRRSLSHHLTAPPPPLPPPSSKARDYSSKAAGAGRELQHELDELRNRGIAKLLNKHFTHTTAQVAKEKAEADAALRDLERRRAQTKKYEVGAMGTAPSSTAELGQFDTLYRDIQQRRAECRRKERETILLYQRYVDKFGATGKVAAPDFQGGISPNHKTPASSPSHAVAAVTPPPQKPNAQQEGSNSSSHHDTSSASNSSEGEDVLQQHEDLNFRNFYRRQLSDRESFVSPSSKSITLEPTKEEEEEESDDDDDEEARKDEEEPAKEEEMDEEEEKPPAVAAEEIQEEERQESDNDNDCLDDTTGAVVEDILEPVEAEQNKMNECNKSAEVKENVKKEDNTSESLKVSKKGAKKRLSFKDSQISSLSRDDEDDQEKSIEETNQKNEEPTAIDRVQPAPEEAGPEEPSELTTGTQNNKTQTKKQSRSRLNPEKTPERPEAEDESIDRPSKPSSGTKLVGSPSGASPELTRKEDADKETAESTSASEVNSEISDGKPREIGTEVPGIMTTENDDDDDSVDDRSIISGLTSINSGVTRQVLDEVESQLELFLQTETAQIRKIMDLESDEDEKSTHSFSEDYSSSSTYLDNDSRRATLRAEDMARRMQRILDDFDNEETSDAAGATVVTDDASSAAAPRKRDGYPKKYKGGPPHEQWIVHYDETYEREYFYEAKTKRTQWDPPFDGTIGDDVSVVSMSGHSRSGHQGSIISHQDVRPSHSIRSMGMSRRDIYRRRRRRKRRRRIAAAGAFLLVILSITLFWRYNYPDVTLRKGTRNAIRAVQSFDWGETRERLKQTKQQWQDKIEYAISDRREREALAERQRQLQLEERRKAEASAKAAAKERKQVKKALDAIWSYAVKRSRQERAQRAAAVGVVLKRIYNDHDKFLADKEVALAKQREEEERQKQEEAMKRKENDERKKGGKKEDKKRGKIGKEEPTIAGGDENELDKSCRGIRRFTRPECRQRKREQQAYTNADLVNVIALMD